MHETNLQASPVPTASAHAVSVPNGQPVATSFPVAHTFGVKAPATLRVAGFDRPGPLTPAAHTDYRFRSRCLSDLLAWYRSRCSGQTPDGLWITGPMGAGKSSLVIETAARLNLNLIQVTARRRLELADLIGHLTVLGGDVLFQDGPLTTALRQGWWLLINEVDLIDPGELAGLNTLLDGGPLVLAENSGEVVPAAPGFGVICTANTAGNGDRDGLYLGSQRMNAALMDRFMLLTVDYPSPADEQAVLAQRYPKLPEPLRDNMIEVANEVRRLFRGEAGDTALPAIELTFSTRTLMRWAGLALCFRDAPQPLSYALDRALLYRAEPETRAAIHGIVQRVFGETPAAP